ncbi:hypothetical protein U1E44_01950 [Arenibacter sp. GZD96]|uniref:hypothetical protein n=1 Tax=Aurantibrevibacter litoralis TaxID=3106030 RepID=UPI002AFFDED2|nr:hypothetical protein [Arenibacter sp. GZD-96]MEA1784842.1 hypothetical protein [Arenibacter sp. GZD-96]
MSIHIYKKNTVILTALVVLGLNFAFGQEGNASSIVVSGEPIAEALLGQWIKEYNLTERADITFNAKAKDADLIIGFAENDAQEKHKDYFSVAKVAVLPVSKANAGILREVGKKGLGEKQIKALFFDDFFESTKKSEFEKVPFQVYTRLGDTGIPAIFAKEFGYEPQSLKGKAIGGNDFHVLLAMKKDPHALSFNALNLIFDTKTRKIKEGFAVVPVDLDGNGRLTEDENVYADLDELLEKLQQGDSKNLKNIAIGELQIEVNREAASKETLAFLKWVVQNGATFLAAQGFLQPDSKTLEKERLLVDQLVLNQR